MARAVLLPGGECVLDRNQYSSFGSRQKETSQATKQSHMHENPSDFNTEASFPRFAEPIPNITVTIGRDALLACVVDNLKGYKCKNGVFCKCETNPANGWSCLKTGQTQMT
uniref:Uncharacterized protein n=1 Tax=Anopheles merus TaxID=30066 RepID=A0A182UWN6_ANOME